MDKKGAKTTKRVKRRLKLRGVLFLACVIVALFLACIYLIKIDVRSIEVVGNSYVRDAEIIKAAGLKDDVTFIGLRSKKACQGVKENPLISSCKIKKNWNFKVEIIVEENTPLFYYSDTSSVVLSDKRKIAIENTYGIPTLINKVPDDILDEFIDGLSKIDSDIIRSISEIEYSPSIAVNGSSIDDERFMLSMNDGNTVYVNNRRIEILSYYDKIYASMGDKKGIYNLDCDFGYYLFKEYGE